MQSEANVDNTQTFLKRLWLIQHLDLLLQESAYHRDFREEETLPYSVLWHWDEPEGVLDVASIW